MNDREREERSIWKLEQAGECVRRQAGQYLVTTAESVTELHDLAELVAFADRVYADHWTGPDEDLERLQIRGTDTFSRR
jgi:hypothetical protein